MRSLLIATLLAGVVFATESEETAFCIDCHTDPDFVPDGTSLFDVEEFKGGVHATMECTDCHEGKDEDAFLEVPHDFAGDPTVRCDLCHRDDFGETNEEYERSVHAVRLGDQFRCSSCHDAHNMRMAREEMPRAERIEWANRACLECHRDAEFRIAAKHDGDHKPSTAHDWLPSLEKHARMRCVVCHTPIEGKDDHLILPKEQATRNCEACHGENAPLVVKYIGEDDRRSWITNPIVFDEAYLPGTVRNRLVDGIVVALFGLAVVGALAHGVLRARAARRYPEGPYKVASFFLYPASTRIWHWTNAILMIVLAVTGMRLHFGGREDPILSFEIAFHVHNLGGALLVILGVAYFIQSLLNGDIRQYLGKPIEGMRGLFRQARYYLYGIFRGEKHPYHATPEKRFNPLQQVAYAGVMYGLFPILMATGIVLLFPRGLPDRLGGKPAVWWFATAHYLSAAGIVAFLIGHLYLITMGDKVGYLLRAMFTGWHKHHVPAPETDAATSSSASSEPEDSPPPPPASDSRA
jgi:thiosulfate reductase cytochrome b subunit